MIKRLSIHALKSIKDLTLSCSNLNILAGVNSSGKSTIIQALLLSKQAFAFNEGLKGRLISLGDFNEIRNYELKDDSIRIELEDCDKTKFITEFNSIDPQTSIVPQNGLGDEYEIPLFFDRIYYLSCHRIGALDIYEKPHGNSNDCGIEGEYALGVLLQNDEYCLPDKLTVADGKHVNTLTDQVNYWLERIVGTVVTPQNIERTNYVQVFYNNNPKYMGLKRFHTRPINIGSGISYVISIIITCLISEDDSIICIENPEIHLHPKAQSELAKFLYFVAESGRQVFIETHSDHIFNGFRVGITTKTMSREKINIQFAWLNSENASSFSKVEVDDWGNVVNQKKDLFDQFDSDLNKMLGI